MSRLLQEGLKGVINTVNDQFSAPFAPQMMTGMQNCSPVKNVPVFNTNCQPYQNSCNMYQPYPTTTYIQVPVPNAAPPYPHPYPYPVPNAAPPYPYPPPACPPPYSYPVVQYTYKPPAPVAVFGTKAVSPPAVQPTVLEPVPKSRHCSQACVPAAKAPGAGEQTKGEAAEEENGNVLLSISSGVQLFIVDAKGQVSSPSSPGYLRIIIISNQQQDSTDTNPLVLLDVCDLLYPLTKDTPVLLATSGIFMFPDSEIPESFVGIVLSSQLPAAEHELFKELLSQLANLKIQVNDHGEESINLNEKVSLPSCNEDLKEKPLRPEWSEKMGNAILSGSTKFSKGFAKKAKSTSTSIHKQGAKIRDNIEPAKTPTKVSPHITQGLNAAETTSRGALEVSRFLVGGMNAVSGQAGKLLAPQVQKHGAKLVPKTMKDSRDGRASNADGAKFVAVNSAKGFSAVWTNLKTGAKDVCKSVATETVATVEYKYGEDAGQATDTALKTVGNAGLAAYNFDRLSIGRLMLSTAMSTAEEMVDENDRQPTGMQKHEQQREYMNVKAM
uniref:Senescence domain-containing protein n=1 Tax=Oryzias latipes TaxID=8090 RepID=A0A3B3HJQ6_ORYLA